MLTEYAEIIKENKNKTQKLEEKIQRLTMKILDSKNMVDNSAETLQIKKPKRRQTWFLGSQLEKNVRLYLKKGIFEVL
jgi:hypothetical protein